MLTRKINKTTSFLRLIKPSVAPLLLTVTFVFSTLPARAQIGGPKDITKPPATAAGNTPPAAPTTKTAANAPASIKQRFENDGIAVEFSVVATPDEKNKNPKLVAGADAVATFRLTDARSGQPLTGMRPNAWISSSKSEQPPSKTECVEKVRSFTGGLLSVRPAIDLNSYLLMTLNHDHTISVINPQIAFSRTKLENVIPLPGVGLDWAMAQDKDHIFVTMPDVSSVAVINTVTRKLVSIIETGDKTKPTRIVLDPSSRRFWVGLDGSPRVAVIDAATHKLISHVTVGEGLHQFAFTPDGRFAYVTNSASNTVTAIDAEKLARVADIKVGASPVPIAASETSKMIYVAAVNGASISVIDPSQQKVVGSIAVKPGTVALRFEPEGRFGFAVNQVESTVSVFDTANNTVLGSAEVVKGPDQITFTQRYAYVRGTTSEKFSLIELGEVAKGRYPVVDVTAGRLAASTMPDDIGVADMIAPTPEGNSAMIASAPDQTIYYYVEGMMAPMGSLSNYKRRPRALMLLDRSLSEITPGVYSTPVKLRSAGRFDVPMVINQARFINCFQLDIADSPDAPSTPAPGKITLQAAFDARSFRPGEPVKLGFKLIDANTKQPITGLGDVQILVFEPPGIWQQRQWAKETSAGEYQVSQVFPHNGFFKVLVRVESRNLRFNDLPMTDITITDQPDAKSSQNKTH